MTAGSSAPKGPEPVRSGATAPDGRPSGRRASVLGALVLAGGVLLTTSGAWVRSTTTTPVDADVVLAVTGSAAAPGVTAGALVVVAAALALALVGRWGRWPACLTLALG
ncbi:MAG: Trp biosynthesis-associated rane protein, partial [Actinotalea sp.]|nr:Trp biosynthesis-associated rane protein [Actinotalea sp.]